MGKSKTVYVCSDCGTQSPKWQGQCPGCGAWNTLVETVVEPARAGGRFESLSVTSTVQTLADVEAVEAPRAPTGIDELDRVLGGGLAVKRQMGSRMEVEC